MIWFKAVLAITAVILLALASSAAAVIHAPSTVEAGTPFQLNWENEIATTVSGNGEIYQFSQRPVSVTLSTPGIYTYTEQFCFVYMGLHCTTMDTHDIEVTSSGGGPGGPSGGPEPLHEQLAYEYEVRAGDFNNNGYTDILVDRLTPGGVDGSLQSVILRQTAGGLSAHVPTSGELSHARTFAIASGITLKPNDINFDRYADLALEGVQSVAPALYDRYVVFAPGEPGVSAPLGLRAVDEKFKSFFGELLEWTGNPTYFTDQLFATISPVFGFSFDCSHDFGFSALMCLPVPSVVGFQVVTAGGGYNPDAFVASIRIQTLDTIGHASGFNQTWQDLSQAFKNSIGVHAFGFRDDGSRVPTNQHPSRLESPEKEANTVYGQLVNFYWMVLRQYADVTVPPPENWVEHHYDPVSVICDTSDPFCTLENVWCWAKRWPAPRQSGSEHIVSNGDLDDVEGGYPIVTWVFDPDRRFVNETRQGHILHDPEMPTQPGCGNQPAGQIPPRCSTVERVVKVSSDGSSILIETLGTGFNPPLAKTANEVGGRIIFRNVDRRIEDWVREQGACPPS